MTATASDLPRLDPQRPWPGLSPFAETDTAFFFGRERETRALAELIERSGVVVLYGQSGLGKTSLLRAGLFPALKASDHVPAWVRLDFGSDAPPLAKQVLLALSAAFEAAGIEAPAPAPGDSLWSYFHRADADFWGPRNRLVRPLIVLDQFEELFTLGQRDAAAAERSERFASELEALLEQRPPAEVRQLIESTPERAADFDVNRENFRFVVSLREDYLPHLDAWRSRMPSLLARRYRLEPMTRQQALEVVLKGGAEVVDAAVAQDIVDFVASGEGQGRVEPAILSVVCEELNDRRLRAGLPRITPQLMSGERSRIIADFYERSFAGIPDDVRDWVEDELLTASGHRDRAALEDARRAGLDPSHLETLVDRRVLHSDERSRVVWVEFTHDLITQPAMASRNERERQRAESAAAQREQGVRDKLRRSRLLSAAFGITAVAMGVLTWWSFQQRSVANQQTQLALEQGQRADAAYKLALTREAEAQQAATAAQRSASQAETETHHAQEAEARARAHLASARTSALQIARRGLAELEREWLEPTLDGGRIVAASLASIDPLVQQFGDTPALLDARHRLYALAALVQAGRGDATACLKLVAQGGLGTAPRAAWQDATAALDGLAAGRCAILKGDLVPAGEQLQHAVAAARRLPVGEVLRHRVLISAAQAGLRAASMRYEFGLAEAQLGAARQAVEQASRVPGMAADELLEARLALLSAEAELTTGKRAALDLHERLQRESEAVSAARRDSLAWRSLLLGYDLDRASALWRMGRMADAEELALRTLNGVDRWLNIDPSHVENQLRRNSAARIHAEILSAWKRRDAAAALIGKIETNLAELLQQQPAHVVARHQLGVLSWLRASYTLTDLDKRIAGMKDSVRTFERMNAEYPDYAEPIRSWSIALRELGDLELQKSQSKELSATSRQAEEDQARAHFEAALQVIGRLSRAGTGDRVADIQSFAHGRLGNLALTNGRHADALSHFQAAARAYRRVQLDQTSMFERAENTAFYDLFISRSLRKLGRLAEANRTDQAALTALEAARKASPNDFRLVDSIAWVHRMAASDHLEQGRLIEALQSQLRAARAVADELRRDPLSRPADEALNLIVTYASNQLQPAVKKAGDDESKRLLAEFEKVRPHVVVTSAEERPRLLAPLLPGDWQHQDLSALVETLPKLAASLKALEQQGWRPLSARSLRLPFYDNASLVELDVQDTSGTPGIAALLVDGDTPIFQLKGASTPIHEFNRTHNLMLRTEPQARQYLRYFLSGFGGEFGLFRPIDTPSDLLWTGAATAAIKASIERRIEPWRFARGDDGTWTAQGTMQYAGNVFLTKVSLDRSGNVTMHRDRPLTEALPLATVHYDKGARIYDVAPALTFTRNEAVKAKRWKAAADALQAWIDTRRQRLEKAQWAKHLPDDLLPLSWYRLLSGEPQQALEAAQFGLNLSPDDLTLQTNRAHALLLLGRQAEAMALYREHMGKRVAGPTSRLWQEEILDDLARFKRQGLSDPRFDAVKALMEGAGR